MISYQPFYDTLLKKEITEYQLVHIHGISANTLYRMKTGHPITTKTLDNLCYILDCNVEDILYHDKSVPPQ
ncbi:MAG: helix-turn-helix domain-containing protein [Eubacteriales bacterium]|nr:helix-turn-helix domain-containing protein [Eubacteriales bacterium]